MARGAGTARGTRGWHCPWHVGLALPVARGAGAARGTWAGTAPRWALTATLGFPPEAAGAAAPKADRKGGLPGPMSYPGPVSNLYLN